MQSVLPVVVSLGLTLAACAVGGGAAAPSEQVQYSSPGEQVYQQSCARCHGWDRGGLDDAPALDATRVATLGDTPLRMTVLYGKGRMPGFDGLSQAQVDDLVAFLRG
jgi:mono/diheme cytochrome c family protein